MKTQPTLETPRLRLRPLLVDDAPVVRRLAGRREIADTTISVPHPYLETQARDWIQGYAQAYLDGKGVGFGVELKTDSELIGTVVVRDIEVEHSQAELSLWIGLEWWGHGYATEAASGVVRHAFDQLGLNRIYGHHMVRNPASGRVLEKIGMKQEGLLRQRVRKWGIYEDVVLSAVLRSDLPSWQGPLESSPD